MKKTLIAFVAALALLGIILFKRGSDRKAMQGEVPAMDSSAVRAAVQGLRIAKLADTAVLVRTGGGWQLKRDSFPADTAKMSRVLGFLTGLKAKEKVSQSPERRKEYGLDSAEARHVALLDAGGKPLAEVVIGKTSGADYSSTYWKWEDKPEVYRTPGNFSYDLGFKEEEWKERKLFGFAPKDMKFLEASWKDTTGARYAYKFEATSDSTWKMLEPVDSNRVTLGQVRDAAARFADMSIDEFVQPADTNVAKAQADSATLLVKATLKDGKSFEFAAGKPYSNYFYVKHPLRQDMIKLSTWRFDVFKKKPFELLEAPPPPPADTAKQDSAAASATAPSAAPASK